MRGGRLGFVVRPSGGPDRAQFQWSAETGQYSCANGSLSREPLCLPCAADEREQMSE
jgi:hypothetical protein